MKLNTKQSCLNLIVIIFLSLVTHFKSLKSSKRVKGPTFTDIHNYKDCQGCIVDKTKSEDRKYQFPCIFDKRHLCYSCSINSSKQDGCKVGCFRRVNNSTLTEQHCWRENNYEENKLKRKKILEEAEKLRKQEEEERKKEEAIRLQKKKEQEDRKQKLIEDLKKKMEEKIRQELRKKAEEEEKKKQEEEIKRIELQQKLFKEKIELEHVKIFLIDTSGSMENDIGGCWHNDIDYKKSHPKLLSRIEIVKQQLTDKIRTMKENQKYYIWESNTKHIFENLDGKKSFSDAEKFINALVPDNIFYYKEAFTALKSAVKNIKELNNVSVSLLTDGGVQGENPSEDPLLLDLLNQGIKKWELILYDKGGCEKDEDKKGSKTIMDLFKSKILTPKKN